MDKFVRVTRAFDVSIFFTRQTDQSIRVEINSHGVHNRSDQNIYSKVELVALPKSRLLQVFLNDEASFFFFKLGRLYKISLFISYKLSWL
jgi:hypothetical protein